MRSPSTWAPSPAQRSRDRLIAPRAGARADSPAPARADSPAPPAQPGPTPTQSAVLPLVPYLDTLRWVFIAVALAGIAVTIYARLDDWRGGQR